MHRAALRNGACGPVFANGALKDRANHVSQPRMSTWESRVCPHGPITPLADGLWQVTGSIPRGGLKRNMVVYRLPDGTLLLHSVVALKEADMAQLEKLGRPSVMVVPNALHRMDAPAFAERYPDIRILAPAGARKGVEQRVRVDATCEEALGALGIEALAPGGLKPVELAYRFAVPGGSALVVTDALFNIPHGTGLEGFVFRYITDSSGGLKISRIGRLLMLKDRALFKQWLQTLAGDGSLRLLSMAHGTPITGDLSTQLQHAADLL